MPKRERPPLFERLSDPLEEAQAFVRGEVNLYTLRLPGPPPQYVAADIIRRRESLQMSPAVSAQLLNVSTKTVQGWERGFHQPAPPVQRLLQVIGAQPDVISAVGRVRGCSPPGGPPHGFRRRSFTFTDHSGFPNPLDGFVKP